jgi:Na+/alanine symporter
MQRQEAEEHTEAEVEEVLETGGKPVTTSSMDRVLARWGYLVNLFHVMLMYYSHKLDIMFISYLYYIYVCKNSFVTITLYCIIYIMNIYVYVMRPSDYIAGS